MRWTTTSLISSFVSLSLLAGCPSREVAEVPPTPVGEELKDIPVSVNRDIDILFVIDNSGSMEDEQNSLAANFVNFINVLENIDGGLPNVHIGVVSTDMGSGPFAIPGCGGQGDAGTLQSTPRGACVGPDDAFIVNLEDAPMPGEHPSPGTMGSSGRYVNYDDSSAQLEDTFSCIARLGIEGCGFEQPFESMRRALDGSNPTNTLFLREEAFLAVIFVMDEDDCSVKDTGMFDTSQTDINSELGPLTSFRCFEFGVQCEPDNPRNTGAKANCAPREDSRYMFAVQEYIDFLQSLKADPGLLIVAAITGNEEPVSVILNGDNQPELVPSCVVNPGQPNEQTAAPAVRLKALIDAFPGRGTTTTICNNDLSDALVLVATLLAKAIGNPCIEADIDIDDDTPGVQHNCQVSDVLFNSAGEQESEQILAECSQVPPGANDRLPCWHLQPEPNCQMAGFPTGLALVVERDSEPPIGTHVIARCQVN